MADMTGVRRDVDSRGRPRYRVRVMFRNAEGVERCRSGTFDTLSEATKERNRWRRERDKRELRPSERITVEEYSKQWMVQNAADGLSDNTLGGYRSRLRYVNAVIGAMRLQDIKRVHVKRVHAALDDMRHHRTGEQLSEGTKTGARRVLHNMLAAAVDDELLDRNPATGRRRRRKKKPQIDGEAPPGKKKAFTAEQVVALRQAALAHKNERLKVLVLIASATGMRRCEVLALRWSDLSVVEGDDGERLGVLRVRRAMVWVGKGGPKYESPKSESAVRDVTVDHETLDALLEWRERQKGYKRMVGSKWHDDTGLIVTNKLGRPWQPNVASREFSELARGLGFDKTLHGLRHSYGSLLADVEGGPSWVELSELMGHGETSITMNTYSTTVRGDAGERAASRLSEAFRAAAERIAENRAENSKTSAV